MTKRDYYEVLEVERGADPATLKSAYRRCAMKYHPDRNPGDTEAEERFKEAAEAYEVLSNPEKRAYYDQFGHAAPASGGFEGFSGMEDILSHFADVFGMGFGGRAGARRGGDLQTECRLTFLEAVTGCRKDVSIDRNSPCGDCGGSGARAGSRPSLCPMCNGRGQVMQSMGFMRIASSCPSCRGQGRVIREKCETCAGGGVVRRSETLALEIPAGVDHGHTMRVTGRGQAVAGGQPGNLYVQFQVEPDPRFEREGDDLIVEAPVTYAQAALGAKLNIPTIEGQETIQIEPGTQSETVRTLRGRGVPHLESRGCGDLHIRFRVKVPTRLTDAQRALIEELSATLETETPDPSPEEETGGFFRRRKKRK